MLHPEDIEPKENTDSTEDKHLFLDGTANLEYFDDDQVPRIKGLVELLTQYFNDKTKQNLPRP